MSEINYLGWLLHKLETDVQSYDNKDQCPGCRNKLSCEDRPMSATGLGRSNQHRLYLLLTMLNTVNARANNTAIIATSLGTPGTMPCSGLIRTTWKPTNTHSSAFNSSSRPDQNVRTGARVASLNLSPVMLPASRPATTVAIGPETSRCWAAVYMDATAPRKFGKCYRRKSKHWRPVCPDQPCPLSVCDLAVNDISVSNKY